MLHRIHRPSRRVRFGTDDVVLKNKYDSLLDSLDSNMKKAKRAVMEAMTYYDLIDGICLKANDIARQRGNQFDVRVTDSWSKMSRKIWSILQKEVLWKEFLL